MSGKHRETLGSAVIVSTFGPLMLRLFSEEAWDTEALVVEMAIAAGVSGVLWYLVARFTTWLD